MKNAQRTEDEVFNDFQTTTWEENPNPSTEMSAEEKEAEALRYANENIHAHEAQTR